VGEAYPYDLPRFWRVPGPIIATGAFVAFLSIFACFVLSEWLGSFTSKWVGMFLFGVLLFIRWLASGLTGHLLFQRYKKRWKTQFGGSVTSAGEEAPAQRAADTDGVDDFGYDPERPIHCTSIPDSYFYLNRLRTPTGKRLKFERRGCLSNSQSKKLIDRWRLISPTGESCTIYISAYEEQMSQRAPAGLLLASE
jgi:hypothetical protein